MKRNIWIDINENRDLGKVNLKISRRNAEK